MVIVYPSKRIINFKGTTARKCVFISKITLLTHL
jgi:hypothetical protein